MKIEALFHVRVAPATALLVAASLAACAPDGGRAHVRVASTTSLYDTGLLDALVPAFHAAHPEYEAQVVAVGTGEALLLGRRGDADMLIAHAPALEEEFVADGAGLRRTTFMRNDFVVGGPEADPAGVAGASDAADAFRRIERAGAGFASRGDGSGTHVRELALWAEAGIEPGGDWYVDVGQGMGATLLIAGERQAYLLTDRATLTTVRANGLDLVELYSGDESMTNLYSVIPVAGAAEPEGAAAFEAWMLGDEAAAIIREFGSDRYGAPLFTLTR
jgi:tungstate transport system substrate-binding protein